MEVNHFMNNVSAMINQMTIKERSDGRFEGRLTVNGNRKSFYGKTKSEVKNKAIIQSFVKFRKLFIFKHSLFLSLN